MLIIKVSILGLMVLELSDSELQDLKDSPSRARRLYRSSPKSRDSGFGMAHFGTLSPPRIQNRSSEPPELETTKSELIE